MFLCKCKLATRFRKPPNEGKFKNHSQRKAETVLVTVTPARSFSNQFYMRASCQYARAINAM
jgi:hypothetical protein